MKVRVGCTTEYARWKFDLELEEPELLQLCEKHGLDRSSLSPRAAFLVLYDEAQVVMAMAKGSSGLWGDMAVEIGSLTTGQDARLSVLRARHPAS